MIFFRFDDSRKDYKLIRLAILISFIFFSNHVVAQLSSSQEVVALVNKERSRLGLDALKADKKLTSVAGGHARDMYQKNYFSHTSLDGSSMGDRLKRAGVFYRAAGENIARGQKTSVQVMQAWMASKGHRKNILNARYGRIGVARVGDVWVQNFSN